MNKILEEILERFAKSICDEAVPYGSLPKDKDNMHKAETDILEHFVHKAKAIDTVEKTYPTWQKVDPTKNGYILQRLAGIGQLKVKWHSDGRMVAAASTESLNSFIDSLPEERRRALTESIEKENT